jgi:hypothetical protein
MQHTVAKKKMQSQKSKRPKYAEILLCVRQMEFASSRHILLITRNPHTQGRPFSPIPNKSQGFNHNSPGSTSCFCPEAAKRHRESKMVLHT